MRRRLLAMVAFLLLAGCSRSEGVKASDEGPSGVASAGAAKTLPSPTLIVWITVDQLRGDHLEAHKAHFSEGGFQRLSKNGVWFKNAHYGHAITETAPGHATLFTGAAPREHGIVGNSWLSSSGEERTSVLDSTFELLGPGRGKATGPGRSPRQLLVPTLGDELIRASQGQSKVVALSSKDRAAILPGGQGGKAFWFGDEGFVTSTYYYRSAPDWLQRHHREFPPQKYLDEDWGLALPMQQYENAPAASPFASGELGEQFPHRTKDSEKPVKALVGSPFGDQAVLDLARTAVVAEALGKDVAIDLLSVSLSSTDLVGHHYGLESREMEDQLIRLDRGLERFFEFLDRELGEERLLFVLSGDHGGCESAHHLKALGLAGGRLAESDLEVAARRVLKEKYEKDSYFQAVVSPYVYLNHRELARDGLELPTVREDVAAALRRVSGVHSVFSPGEANGDNHLHRLIHAARFWGRSGDLYVVPKPYTHFMQSEGLAATHGSPWSYDTHVPILISHSNAVRRQVRRRVDVRQLVPTVAELVGAKSPPGATLEPLAELFE